MSGSHTDHCDCFRQSRASNASWVREYQALLSRVESAEARADRILDAYHMSYRHGPDPDPTRCPGCHAAALEDV